MILMNQVCFHKLLIPREIRCALFKQAQLAYCKHDYLQSESLWRLLIWLDKQHISCEVEVWCTEIWLADSLMEHGAFAEAEPLLIEAVGISRRIGAHPSTEMSLSTWRLASLYLAQRRWKEAEAMYSQCLEIRRNAFGIGHPKVTSAVERLALVRKVQAGRATAVLRP